MSKYMMSKYPKKVFARKVLRSREILTCLNMVRRRRRRRAAPPKEIYNIPVDTPIEQKVKEEIKETKPHRKRFHRCCVPNCPTFGPSDQFMPFPSSDSFLRRIWLEAIPRRRWFVCHDTRICRNHFNISHDGRITEKNIPTLFPEPITPNLEDKYRKIDKGMFQVSGNYALPETFGDLALVPNCDKFIFDVLTLISNYKEELKVVLDVCRWTTQENQDNLVFYRLCSVDNCVKISTSVSIDHQLRPTVALEGVIMDPLDFTRHVPVNGRITHWDQLHLMLLDFGYDREGANKGVVSPFFDIRSDFANIYKFS